MWHVHMKSSFFGNIQICPASTEWCLYVLWNRIRIWASLKNTTPNALRLQKNSASLFDVWNSLISNLAAPGFNCVFKRIFFLLELINVFHEAGSRHTCESYLTERNVGVSRSRRGERQGHATHCTSFLSWPLRVPRVSSHASHSPPRSPSISLYLSRKTCGTRTGGCWRPRY